MTRYIFVEGTHGYNSEDSLLLRQNLLQTPDVEQVLPAAPFSWDTALDGLWGKNLTWRVAGQHLKYYAVPPLAPQFAIPSDELLIITFSHGAQVALHAFALGLKGSLITVNPPVRGDMEDTICLARPNIRRWLNIYGSWRDVFAILGAFGDMQFGLRRKMPHADGNILADGGHGAALREPALAAMWPRWVRYVMAHKLLTK